MKVLDRKRNAELLADRILNGVSRQFGGTFPLEADLDDDVIDGCKMRGALERFGRRLAAQYDKTGSGSRVIGVELHSISFSFITVPTKPRRAD